LLSFSVLASGSSGNSIYIKSRETSILLDAGISAKQLNQRLQVAAESSIADLSAILVTHEHSDHVKGLKQTIKLSKAPVYLTEGTQQALPADVNELYQHRLNQVAAGHEFMVGDIRVTVFAVSHDATEPVAYRFDTEDGSLAVITDLGYLSDTIKSVIEGCQTFVLEANHDESMLRAGPYPWHLKRRILGDKGHLSNTDAAVGLSDILSTDEVHVYLAHLSSENNQPDLAELTVSSVLREMKSQYADNVILHRTSRHEPTALRYANPAHLVR